jgi:toxin secretion/phage lysis holin
MNPINWICTLLDQATFKSCCATLLGVFGWMLGGIDLPFRALMLLAAADYGLGFFRAFREHRLSFAKIKKGIHKFILYVVTVMAANLFDMASGGAIPWLDNPARDFMICYLAVCEFLSVSVHLSALGIRMPLWLLSRVERFRNVAETGECKEAMND